MKNLPYYFLLLFLVACNPNQVYKDYQTMPKNEWDKSKAVEFQVNLEETNVPYNLIGTIRYNTAISHAVFDLQAQVLFPSGKDTLINFSAPRADAEGNLIAEEMGGIGDIEKAFLANYTPPESGTYTIKLQQKMEPQTVGGILEVGLKVEKN